MDNKKINNPFGRNHGVHKDQLRRVDHRRQRREERHRNRDWEGKR